jgi:hypothetical protein
MNRVVKIVLAVFVVVVVAAGSFYGGVVYGKGQAGGASSAQTGTAGSPPGQRPVGTPPAGQGGMLLGQIQAIDNEGFTVTDSSGKQVQVHVTDTTLIQEQASVSLANLQQGDTVMVSGTQASDGSITARSVQVGQAGTFGNPAGGNPPGGQGTGSSGGSTNP